MHFILNGGKKSLCDFGVRVIIHARRVNIRDFLVKTAFGGSDIPYAFKQFVEIINLTGMFKPFVIHHKTFDQIFPQTLRGPDSKLRTAMGTDPITN